MAEFTTEGLDGMAFAYDDAARVLDQAADRIESGEADR